MQKNNLLKLGKYVNTHGVKGEIRLLSDFDYKEELKPGNKVYIKNLEFEIQTNRKHKTFTLLTFNGINSINDIEHLKGNYVYGEKISEEISIPEYIDYEVYLENEFKGKVIDYFQQGINWSIVIELNDGSTTNIPMVDKFIEKTENNKIFLTKDNGII